MEGPGNINMHQMEFLPCWVLENLVPFWNILFWECAKRHWRIREEVAEAAWSSPGRQQGGGPTGTGPPGMNKISPSFEGVCRGRSLLAKGIMDIA